MTTIPQTPSNGEFSLNDYLTKRDIERVTKLATTTVTTRIINGAILNDHYIVGEKQVKQFKKSFVKDRVKLIKPMFDLTLIDNYTTELIQPVVKEQPVATSDNPELVQSLRDHIQSLRDQLTISQIENERKQELLEKTLEITVNYQKQFNATLMRENQLPQAPTETILNNNDILSQTQKEKPKSWLSWLGF